MFNACHCVVISTVDCVTISNVLSSPERRMNRITSRRWSAINGSIIEALFLRSDRIDVWEEEMKKRERVSSRQLIAVASAFNIKLDDSHIPTHSHTLNSIRFAGGDPKVEMSKRQVKFHSCQWQFRSSYSFFCSSFFSLAHRHHCVVGWHERNFKRFVSKYFIEFFILFAFFE